jgi:hypothetical protein
MQARLQSRLMRRRQPEVESVWARDEQLMACESPNALESDIERVSQYGDFTEATCEHTPDGVRELQLR